MLLNTGLLPKQRVVWSNISHPEVEEQISGPIHEQAVKMEELA
jgi:hypothetical protein